MYRWAGLHRTLLVLTAVLALVASSCADHADEQRVVATKTPRTSLATTTTTTPPALPPQAAASVPFKRVRVLPGERAARPPKPAPSYHGPSPTGRILIPRIGLDHLTYEGIDLETIDHGPSHWPGTALPGQVGNTVFPGHRVTHDHPYFDIDHIQVGDRVAFVNGSGRYTYEVTETFVVNADETWIANPTDTPTMTLFGCHPKHSAKQRYVVKGRLVQTERAVQPKDSSAPPPSGDGNTYAPPEDPNAPPPTTTTAPKSLIPTIGG